MAKAVVAQVKVQITGGQATPAPPVGTALGPHGINLGKFVQEFNAKTKDMEQGTPIPVKITVFSDRSFAFEMRMPPATFLIKKAVNLKSGSKEPGKVTAGKIKRSQLAEIAQVKMKDLNANDIDAATKIIEGSARSMGLEVVEG